MAHKPTKAERGRTLLTADWTDEENNDPEVLRMRKEYEERKRLREERQKADFSGVSGDFRGPPQPPVEEEDDSSYASRGWGGAFDRAEALGEGNQAALAGGAKRSLAGLMTISADPEAVPGYLGEFGRWEDAKLQEIAPGYHSSLVGIRKNILDQRQGLVDAAAVNQAEADKTVKNVRTEFGRQTAEAIQDFAGSPSSALSILGGPVSGAIAGLDTYAQEYQNATLNGVDPSTARVRAEAMGTLEGGISSIPAGSFLGKIPGVRRVVGKAGADLLKDDVTKIAVRTGKTILGEAAEEGVTQAAQIGVDQALSQFAGDEKTRNYAAANTVDFWNQVWRATKAGAVGGTALGGVHSSFEVAAEAGKLVSQAKQSNDQQRKGLAYRRDAETARQNEEARLADEKARSFQAHENDVVIDPQLKADQEEAAYRTLERQRTADALRRGASLDQVPGPMQAAFQNTQVIPVTAEDVAAERTAAVQEKARQANEAKALVERAKAAEDQKATAEVKKLIAKDTTSVTKAANTSHAKARNTALKGILATSRELPAEQRVATVKEQIDAWDAANPKANFVAKAAAPKPAARKPAQGPRRPTTTKTPAAAPAPVALEENETPQVAPKRDFAEIKKELGLSSVPTGPTANATQGVSSEQAINHLAENVAKGDAKKVLKLVADGNAVIIDGEQDVPEGSVPAGAGAFYDGEHTYIVANKLDPKNITGDLLKFAAHETKHAADLSGNKTLKASVGQFIGTKANAAIRAKIEALAAKGNPFATEVIKVAKKNSTPETYDLELPAYWINYAMERRETTGQPRRVVQDIVSAVRTSYKKMKGSDDVNLDDVGYMSRKLLEEAGLSGERLEGKLPGKKSLPTIAGKTATGIEEARKNHLTYKSADGTEKFLFSDREYHVNASGPEKLSDGKLHPVKDIIKHNRFFEQYPGAEEFDVGIDEGLRGNNAYLDFEDKSINVSKDTVEMARNGDPGQLADHILHELQHYIQDTEGSARGGSTSMFYTKEDDALTTKYNEAQTRLGGFQQMLTNKASRDINIGVFPELNNQIIKLSDMFLGKAITRTEYLSMVGDLIEHHPGMKERGKVIGRGMQSAAESVRTLGSDMNKLFQRQRDQYLNLLGEMEARFTTNNAHKSVEDLPINPEESDAGMAGAFDRPMKDALINKGIEKWRVTDTEGNEVISRKNHPIYGRNMEESSRTGATIGSDALKLPDAYIAEINDLIETWKKREQQMTGDDASIGDRMDWHETYDNLRKLIREFQTLDKIYGDSIRGDTIPERQRVNTNNYQRLVKRHEQKLSEERSRVNGDEQARSDNDPRSGISSSALASAASRFSQPNNRVTRKMQSVIKALAGSLKTYGNLGRELGVMKEDADGEAALHAHNAMNYFNWLNRGVSRMAKVGVAGGKYKTKAEGITAVTDMIREKMDQIAALPEENRREAALAAFVRQNPDLDGLMAAVQEVRQLSRTLLKQMVLTTDNPTNEELLLMNTVMDNSFRYTTQMYAAFQGPAGRVHSQQIIDHYDRAAEILASGKPVPEKLRRNFEIYRDALKYLIDNDLTIPEIDELDSSSTKKLMMLYDSWIGDASRIARTTKEQSLADGLTVAQANQAVRDTLAAGLDEKRDSIKDTNYEGKARDLILGMLDLSNEGGPFANYYRGFKQDRSILERREGLPQEIKDLFGEITDPATRLAVTIAKQGELVARTRMLLDMRDNGTGKWVIPPEQAGLPGKRKFTATLKGENFGPLNGYRTTPEIAAAISDNLEMFSTLSDAMAQSHQNSEPLLQAGLRVGGKALRGAAKWQKILSVVIDPYNMALNFGGSFVTLVANGLPIKGVGRGARTAIEVIADSMYTKSGELSPSFADAIRHGVLDSARVQEIRRTPQKFVKDLISVKPKAVRATGKVLSKALSGTVEAFAMSDAWTKIASFENRQRQLKSFYEAEGITKSDEDIKKEAADQIKDTNITYARTPPLVRTLESFGVTTFMPYFVSVPRAIMGNMVLGIQDTVRATNAKTDNGKWLMMQSGIRRITGAYAASAGFVVLTKVLASMFNDKDDDKVEEQEKLLFDDARFADSFYLGTDAAKKPMFARFSRIDPFGPANDLLRIAVDDTITPEEKRRHMIQMLKDMVITNRVVIGGLALAEDIIADKDTPNKNTKLERITGSGAEFAKDWLGKIPGLDYSDTESIVQFADSFTPGIADLIDPKNRNLTKAKGPFEQAIGDAIVWSGGRMDVADPGLAASRVGKLVETARTEGRSRLAAGVATGRSPEKLAEIFVKAAAKEQTALQEASRAYEGMTKGLGLTPRQASDILKKEGSLTESDVANIRQGRVNQELEEWLNNGTRMLSKTSLENRGSKGLTEAEKKQKKADNEAFLKAMKALGYKVRKE